MIFFPIYSQNIFWLALAKGALSYLCTFDLMQLAMRSLAVIVTALIANWWSILPASVFLGGLLLIRWYYLKTAREVKRLEALGTLWHGVLKLWALSQLVSWKEVFPPCVTLSNICYCHFSQKPSILPPLCHSPRSAHYKGIQKTAHCYSTFLRLSK